MKLGISLLKNPIQEYAWGSRTFIADMLGEPCPAAVPQAELWLGAHPKGTSLVSHQNRWIPLPEWIAGSPDDVLGASVAARFSGKLPFLLKVLAAERPLSIQAHPNLDQARVGFARESCAGILPNAPIRNYRDDNHKPELLCALTPFWALKGFRHIRSILDLFEGIGIPELLNEITCLRQRAASSGLQGFFSRLLSLEKGSQRHLVSRVVSALEKKAHEEPAFAWVVQLNRSYPGDIGALSPLFLNLLHLQPGEAIFLHAGTLHAYLSGTGIEVMANSDNVLRGGLTSKHIDIEELLRVVRFDEDSPAVIHATSISSLENQYTSPAEEFLLSRIQVESGRAYRSDEHRSVEILLCTEGSAVITGEGLRRTLEVTRGKSFIVPACVRAYRIDGQGTFYKASVPLSKT